MSELTDFNSLSFNEQKKVMLAVLAAGAGEWGDQCFAASEFGDNRLYDMTQLCEWVEALQERNPA